MSRVARVERIKGEIMADYQERADRITEQGDAEMQQLGHRLREREMAVVKAQWLEKHKKLDTRAAIMRSAAINNLRLQKIRAQNEKLLALAGTVKSQLWTRLQDQAEYKALLEQLILQGLVMLLEEHVVVQCREVDVALVEGCLPSVAEQFSARVKDASGDGKKVTITVDATRLPPPPTSADGEEIATTCLGGVKLLCRGDSIIVDNTLDARLRLTMEHDKPAIRKILFGAAV